MQSKATTPEQYLSELPEDRKEAMLKLRNAILENETPVSSIRNVDRKCKKSKSIATTSVD